MFMATIRETELPGIGRKFQVEANSGDKLVIVVHDDGRRELYLIDTETPDEAELVMTLEDTEARQVASIIGGMVYKPKALETVEVTLEDLVIEWVKIEPHFQCIGKSIFDLDVRQRTGATVLAMVEKHRQVINPGPDEPIKPHMTLVVAGERKQIKQLKELLTNG